MTRPVQSLNRAFGYRLVSPLLFLPWIWTQFFASAISWAFIALYSVWTWNVTFYYIPIWSMGAFFLLAPFQESQVPVIKVVEFLADEIDDIMNDTIFPGLEDMLYIVQPGCWGYNFLWDAAMALFRIGIYDPITFVLRTIFPTTPMPFPVILAQPLSTSGFPITIEIDTSSSPDWIVGPYGRSAGTVEREYLEHPLLDGSRRIDPDDPAAAALVRWLARDGGGSRDPAVVAVPFAIYPEMLDRWTNPQTPEHLRRSLSERMLRRAMDRTLGIEEPGWWEDNVPGQPEVQSVFQTSPWNRVFEIPGGDMRGVAVVRMDTLPDLAKAYGEAKARGVELPPGSVAYRFLPDDKGTRALNFQIFQDTAAIFNTFFDAIATVIAELFEIMLFVADFLFGNLEAFFSNAIEFVANVFNQVFAELLGIPCLKFDSIEQFAISLLDCICGPLQQFLGQGAITNWFNYSRPADVSELPQAVLNCVGLACIDISLLLSDPNEFAAGLLGGCMGLPDEIVCCVIDPINCFINTVIELTNCPCTGNLNVAPPGCDYPSNSGDEWLRCIVIWIMNEVLANINSDNCGVTTCESAAGLARAFAECIAFSILELDDFVDALISLVGGIFGGDGGGFISGIFGRMPREGVNDESDGNWVSYTQLDKTYDHRVKYSKDAPWTEDGAGGRGRSGVRTPHDRLRSKMEEDGPGFAQALVEKKRVRRATNSSSNKVGQMVTEVSRDYGEAAGARVLAMFRERRDERKRAFYTGAEPSDAQLDMMARHVHGPTAGLDGLGPMQDDGDGERVSFIRQLSHVMGRGSKSRHRAQLQVRINRRLYSNPYLRQATWRLVEILRDLQDFAELRVFGPDPFALPPEDADPEEDPRVDLASRYIDETAGQNGAYALHKAAIHDSPYYAGLYKMLFQLGGADSIGRDEADDEVWEAMGEHRDDPFFHLGRMMAASRQTARAMTEVAKEVWWDPDTFSFHFPNYGQIHSVLVRAHLPAYLDDMRDSMSGLFRTHTDQVNHLMMDKAMAYTDEVERDPSAAEESFGGPAHVYSWLVQAEVAIRTVTVRLLSPRHLDAMLDELSTRSPLHARYSVHMRQRVRTLREDSPHDQRDLLEQIVDWRRERGGTTDEVVPGTGGDVRNRPMIDLDPEAHPDAGNRTLQWGDRVRFADGQMGTYLGTAGSKTPRSPTARGFGMSARMGHPSLAIGPRELTVAAVFQGFIKVVQFLAKNWKLIATGFMTVATSPWGRVVWESYVVFLYNRIVFPLYSQGLRGVFSSIFDFLDLAFDFVALSNAIIMFAFNEAFRWSLCFVWVIIIATALWPFFIMINIVSFGMAIPFTTPIWLAIIVFGLFFPYCPPEQIIEDSHMTQTPFQYADAIVKCFGDPNLFGLSIGKDVYNGICSVSTDCPGNAPCICENKGGQFDSTFVQFFDDTPCGTAGAPTGQCLCWPKLDCQFLFPRIDISQFFSEDCTEVYGYRINDITWYQTSDYVKVFVNAYLNFWISLRYILRQVTSSPAIEPLLFPLLIAISFLVLFYGSVYFGVALLVAVMAWQYALPKWTDITVRWIIPGLGRVSSRSFWPFTVLANWLLGFLRFPNFSDASPLGSPGPGEGVCWFFNAGTLFGGGSVAFWFWATILALLWYGLGPIIWFLFNNIATPFRIIYAPIWLYWQRSRLSRHFDKAKQIIRSSVPDWMRRGAGTAGATLWDVTSNVGSRLAPAPPDSALNRWINQYYPDPRQRLPTDFAQMQQRQQDFTVIRGGLRGYGAGTLEHETDPVGTVLLRQPAAARRWAAGAARRRHPPPAVFYNSDSGDASGGDMDDHEKET